MKSIVLLGCLLLSTSGFATSIVRPEVVAQVKKPDKPKAVKPTPTWLEDGKGLLADGTIREETITRLVAPLLTDPQTAVLVEDALRLSGQSSLGGILKVCPWNWGKDNWTQGQTNSSYVTQTALPRASDMTPARKAERKAYYKKVIQEFIAEHPNSTYFVRANQVGYAMMVASKSQDICLAPNISLKSAQSVLVHELVHFVFPGGANRIEPQGLRDAQEYSRFRLTAPGGEADAFRAAFSASARWSGSTQSIPADIRGLFDVKGNYLGKTSVLMGADGRPLGRAEDPVLEKYVLSTLGYGKSFVASYQDVLGYLRQIFTGLVDRVLSQTDWAYGNPDILGQIDAQVEELRSTLEEIDTKKSLLPETPASP